MTTRTPWSERLRWIAAAVLCGTVLVALWITAWRVRALKLAARDASHDNAPIDSGDSGLQRLTLTRARKLPVGHFTLSAGEPVEDLSIHDSRGAHLVNFLRFKRGEIRRWQELQLTLLESGQDSVTLECGFRPGQPCFGAGRYVALREGLRIEFPERRSVTVLRFDAQREEIRLGVEAAGKQQEFTLTGPRGEQRILSLLMRFERPASGPPSLLVEEE